MTIQKIKDDMDNIWARIYKPENIRDRQITSFFDFEFKLLPNYAWQEEDWHKEAEELANRFDIQSPYTLFLPKGDSCCIPMDGYAVFLEQTWNTVKTNKELNLPDQRRMVAQYRCSEIK